MVGIAEKAAVILQDKGGDGIKDLLILHIVIVPDAAQRQPSVVNLYKADDTGIKNRNRLCLYVVFEGII